MGGLLWTSRYSIEWTPILTFTRRRLELLDWFEQNVQPVAFVDEPNVVGIAVVSPDLRLTTTRRGVELDIGPVGGSVDTLLPALEGIFEVLDPKDATMEWAGSRWTASLNNVDYNEERARFAAMLCGTRGRVADFRPIDGSGLADLESSEILCQTEWGVVEREELFERLTQPGLGRLRAPAPARPSEHVGLRGRLQEEGSDVSLLIDVSLRRKVGGQVGSAEEVRSAAQQADEVAAGIVDALYDGFTKGREDRREFA